MGRLLDAIAAVYGQLGFDKATGRDAVFEQLVTARIIEPTSKQDAARVLAEAGVGPSYRTVKRALPGYATPEWRAGCPRRARPPPIWARRRWCCTTSRRCGSRPTPVTGSASRGSPRNAAWTRRSPSGCSPTRPGCPLMVDAFEGNRAETTTMIPLMQRFMAAHRIAEVTVVADAGMMSEANQADRGRRLELHPRREAARGALRDQPVAAGTPTGSRPTAWC